MMTPTTLRTASVERSRSIVAAKDIPAGTVVTAEHLTVKRPGFGIAPKHLELLVGRTASVDIEFDDILLWEMF